jgi:hypothetical protein
MRTEPEHSSQECASASGDFPRKQGILPQVGWADAPLQLWNRWLKIKIK